MWQPALMLGDGTMTSETAFALPTSWTTSTFTDASGHVKVTAIPHAQHTIATLARNPPTSCSACDDSVPGMIVAGMPTYFHRPTPTAAVLTNSNNFVVTHGDGTLWYQHPWTLPAAYAMFCYAIFSGIAMAIMLFTGRLDTRGNLHVGRLGRIYRRRRSIYELRMNAWTNGLSTWEDTAPYRWATQEEMQAYHAAQARDQLVNGRTSVAITHISQPRNNSRASVAETETIFDTEQHERAVRRWSTEPLHPSEGPAIELQHFPAGTGNNRHYAYYHRDDGGVVRVTDGEVSFASEEERARLRQAVAYEQCERHAQMLRLHHLNQMQTSMARAGWM
ncbi:hypothetical protein LTR27_009154 [Elasticomyces elasticus]|nr:hypothetical protein LTR27_009154 [Elasticomyces elasticus]